MASCTVPSPVGRLTIVANDESIVAVEFADPGDEEQASNLPLLASAASQLAEYFSGKRRLFDLPVAPTGTVFRRRVWHAMRAIPYGRTQTYGDLARTLDSAPRAVGQACGANPIPIIIPCHRVVASGGRLGGFSGGEGCATKRQLLALEAATFSLSG